MPHKKDRRSGQLKTEGKNNPLRPWKRDCHDHPWTNALQKAKQSVKKLYSIVHICLAEKKQKNLSKKKQKKKQMRQKSLKRKKFQLKKLQLQTEFH